jgi:hypothetical protein
MHDEEDFLAFHFQAVERLAGIHVSLDYHLGGPVSRGIKYK